MISSEILLEGTNGRVNVVGKPIKAVGMYSHLTSSTLNTIAIYTTKFVGRIHIFGTLCLEPKNPLDWVELNISDCRCCSKVPYIELNNEHDKELHKNFFVNVDGAYTYLRAEVDRSYLDFINNDLLHEETFDDRYMQLTNSKKLKQDFVMYKESIMKRIGVVNKIVLTI